ncbi:MAG: hypothetical protein IKD94_04700 [Erysipelotrichaceae bacterium]|nr:hypothetical protein [Erysipelotrichaceae bacterium]
MQLPQEEEKKDIRRLLESRLRILCNQGFYGSLLMHMNFALDDKIKNVGADRRKIYFNPSFLDELTNRELDMIMIHEVVHLSLRHNSRSKAFEDKQTFDEAADIVVNSNILKSFNMAKESITLKGDVQPHQAPDKQEGYEFSVEELYDILYEYKVRSGEMGLRYEMDEDGNVIETEFGKGQSSGFDDHSKWGSESDEGINDQDWEKYTMDACEMMFIRDPSNSRGLIPGYAARAYMELKQAQTDWRTLLNNFIQEEVNDYSFSPPDRRFSDNPFFLPDFNDTDEVVKNVLFMIDTSGSMSDAEITAAYSEVAGAIDQFGGKLQGWLGFFDAAIVEPKQFSSEDELKVIRPYGGGGTDFGIIFAYVRDQMQEHNVTSIVILTDGYATWPDEEASMGIPTIWLINNKEVTPPWGKVARIQEDKKRSAIR